MKILTALFALVFLAAISLFVWSRLQVREIEARIPAAGSVTEIGGREIHFLDVTESDSATLPPVLFIHGASGNLLDQALAYRDRLEGQGRLIFIDRPGHGYSQRGREVDNTPAGHAAVYAELLDDLDLERAVVVCHSMGCASAAAMAVLYPQKIKGLVFVAPATHSWTTGVAWYYTVASTPIIGHLFTELLALPLGKLTIADGIRSVFHPNPVPADYALNTGAELGLRPHEFRDNARDVAGLNAAVTSMQGRYSEIDKPTVIITGSKDDIVAPELHSIGLERDIKGAQLIIGDGVGHKPDFEMTDKVIEAIHKVAR